jgi:hypothetical protein
MRELAGAARSAGCHPKGWTVHRYEIFQDIVFTLNVSTMNGSGSGSIALCHISLGLTLSRKPKTALIRLPAQLSTVPVDNSVGRVVIPVLSQHHYWDVFAL